MKIICIDYGEKRAGIAISDEGEKIAFPYKSVEFIEEEKFIEEIKKIIEKEKVYKIVLGNPIHMNGTKGRIAIRVENLKKKIENSIKIQVILWDERLTTFEAEKYLIAADFSRKKRKKERDKITAGIILQSYLDWEMKKNDSN